MPECIFVGHLWNECHRKNHLEYYKVVNEIENAINERLEKLTRSYFTTVQSGNLVLESRMNVSCTFQLHCTQNSIATWWMRGRQPVYRIIFKSKEFVNDLNCLNDLWATVQTLIIRSEWTIVSYSINKL